MKLKFEREWKYPVFPFTTSILAFFFFLLQGTGLILETSRR